MFICCAAAILNGAIAPVAAQTASPSPSARKFEITDNSFLVEESFNQEAGVVQNIFTWTRDRDGAWAAAFTQEWPAPNMSHQFSYTLAFEGHDSGRGIGDVLLNYRYQLLTEGAGRPAVSPRVSVVLPTGHSADGFGNGVVGWQLNIPVSKQFGDVYLHANAGLTWLPAVTLLPGTTTANLTSPMVAGSAIWRVAPMFNLMLESVVALEEGIEEAVAARSRSVTISPGFRRGWNLGERQIVIGAALPVTHAADRTTLAVLLYASYELPFNK